MAVDSRIGSELAGYRIERVLGRGGMSVVYLAQHLGLGRRVALKVLAPDLAGDERFRERFVRESKIAAGIEHPNIIPVYEAGEAEGILYIAMRYVRGTDLKSLIRSEGRLELPRAIGLLSQVGSALDAAHAEGLVHRDVKPANVLIAQPAEGSPREHVYLSDFGLTKRPSSDSGITATGQFVGTLDYAAPEQFEGKALDRRTDVYSLGCVLYEALTGSVPFKRDQDAGLMFAHLISPPPKATEADPELPPAIDSVVARGMAKKPEDRYQSAGGLIEGARAALGLPSGEFALPGAPPLRRRPRWLVPALAAALAGIVAVVAVVVTSGGRGTPSPGPTSGALAITGNAVARIDPRTRKLSRVVSLPGPPTSIVAGEGAIWVTQQGGTVTRVGSATQAQTIGLGGDPSEIAAGDGRVWVLDSSSITPISGTGSVGDPIDVSALVVLAPLAVGGGTVWVGTLQQNGSGFSFLRIDPGTGKVVAQADVNDALTQPALAIGEGALWATSTGSLFKISPQSGRLLASFGYLPPSSGFGTDADPVAVGAGSVWIANGHTQTLYRVDAATGQVTASIRIHGTPNGTAAGGDHVWVSTLEGDVFEIETGTDRVVGTTHVGGIPVGVTVDSGGDPWVAIQKG